MHIIYFHLCSYQECFDENPLLNNDINPNSLLHPKDKEPDIYSDIVNITSVLVHPLPQHGL